VDANKILAVFSEAARKHAVVLSVLLLSACGGGGSGGTGPTGGGTNTPTSTVAPTLTLELGSPSFRPNVIQPSDGSSQVTFLAKVNGDAQPPSTLVLEEVSLGGDVLNAQVTELYDSGTGADVNLGDRTYTGVALIGSVTSVEKYYRVKTEFDGELQVSNATSLWVSGCPSQARPSRAENAVFDTQTQANIFADEVMISVNPGVAPDLDTINAIAAQVNGRVVGCIPALREYLLEIEGDGDASGVYAAIATLLDDESIATATVNVQVIQEAEGEADTCQGAECQWYLERIRAPQAWNIVGGGDQESAVAVIDFGVDCSHPELGCDDALHNEDIIDHGTGVASLIGAIADDGTDVSGVAWNTDIYPHSFIGSGGSQYKMNELINNSLSEESVKVINISAATALDPNDQIRDSICNAIDSGRLVVVSAGNASQANSCELTEIYPAKYNSVGSCSNGANLQDGLIVVGATDIDNNLAEWSGQCSNVLYADVFAPGEDVYTASVREGYIRQNGTSFSAPLVSGSAAVAWSANPELTVKQIHDRLVSSGGMLASESQSALVQSSDARVQGKMLLDLYNAVGGDSAAPGEEDVTPDAFAIDDVSDQEPSAAIESAPVTVSGVDSKTTIDISGGFYSIDGGPFTGAAGVIEVGQEVVVQVKTQPLANTQFDATLTIGGVTEVFSVTTGEVPSSATDFSFFDALDVELGAEVLSDILSLDGLAADTPVSIVGGEFSIDGAAFTSEAGVINPGQTLQLRATAPERPNTEAILQITVGATTETFRLLTKVLDISPEVFVFAPEESIVPGAVVISDEIIVEGLNTPTLISISGGDYAIDEGAFSNLSGLVSNGQRVRIRVTAPSNFNEESYVTLTIGELSTTFRLATEVNDPPVISDISVDGLSGSNGEVGDALVVSYTYSDTEQNPEGDTVFRWLRNGIVIDGATGTSYTLVAEDNGALIRFEATPVAEGGVPAGETVFVEFSVGANGVPVANNVSVQGNLVVGGLLSGQYNYSDPDDDLEGLSTFRWLRDGVAIAEATDQTYIVDAADSGMTISFEVTPVAVSGILVGAPVSAAVVIVNSPPVASDVLIEGDALVGAQLLGRYAYSDVDNDAEGISTFRWLRDDIAIDGATGSTYTLVAADSDSTIRFEVTPVASTGNLVGVPEFEDIILPNAAPTAESVEVLGDVAVGNTLQGDYTYSDIDGDAEGVSTFRWLMDDVVLDGEVSDTLLVTENTPGTQFTFEVTPVAASGTLIGNANSATIERPVPLPTFVSGLARYIDTNLNGTLDEGDQIVVPFNQAVTVDTSLSSDDLFILPVDGDNFGVEALPSPSPIPSKPEAFGVDAVGADVAVAAAIIAGPEQGLSANEVVIVLDAFPRINVVGVFGAGLSPGFPSGIDVSDVLAEGAIVGASGTNAEPSTPIDIVSGIALFTNLSDPRVVATSAARFSDVDGDGDMEIVTANRGGENMVFDVTSTGESSVVQAFGGATESTALDLGDIDNDGDVDLVVVNYGGEDILYLNGDGVFTASGTAISPSFNSVDVDFGYIDSDGLLDVVVTTDVVGIGNRVYINSGNNTFVDTQQNIGIGASQASALGDIDGDGDTDIVVVNFGENDQIFLNNGQGVFNATTINFGAAEGESSDVALGDIDQDGDMDILVTSLSFTEPEKIFRNQGNLSFIEEQLFDFEGLIVQDGLFEDLDSDGDLDIVLAVVAQGPRVFYNSGAGRFDDLGLIETDRSGASTVAVGDVDSDGDADIVTSLGNQGADIYLNASATALRRESRPRGNLGFVGRTEIIESGVQGVTELSLPMQNGENYLFFANILDTTPRDGNGETKTYRFVSDTTVPDERPLGTVTLIKETLGTNEVAIQSLNGIDTVNPLFNDPDNVNYQVRMYGSHIPSQDSLLQYQTNLELANANNPYVVTDQSSLELLNVPFLDQMDIKLALNVGDTVLMPMEVDVPGGTYWFEALLPISGTPGTPIEISLAADGAFQADYTVEYTLNNDPFRALNNAAASFQLDPAGRDADELASSSIRISGTIYLTQTTNLGLKVKAGNVGATVLQGGHIAVMSPSFAE